MVTALPNRWPLRSVTFVLWALAAASVVYWGLKLSSGRAVTTSAVSAARAPAPIDAAAVARLLGSGPAAPGGTAPSIASRFNLLGVVAGRNPQSGAALIAIEGKPPKPFRVGSAVDGLMLQSVRARSAVLAESATGPAVVTLELPLKK